MRWLTVLHPGMLTTVQDPGRFGYAHLGVSPAGAADWLSFRAANRLLGNPDDAAALEMTLQGGRFRFEQAAVFALAGAPASACLDGQAIPLWSAVPAPAGAELNVGPFPSGCRCYLAVAGGIGVEPVLASRSTDLRGGFGGLEGRRLRKGDRLPLAESRGQPWKGDASYLWNASKVLRVVPGPQRNAFGRLDGLEYTVGEDSNRLGVRLRGDPVQAVRRMELLTEGVALGAVQIPPDGQPIILLVDQQTTGGYPKPANVVLADIPRLAQLRPRDRVRLEEVTLEIAEAELRRLLESLPG